MIFDKFFKIAGSLDIVYRDTRFIDEKFVIIDWKRVKRIRFENMHAKSKTK